MKTAVPEKKVRGVYEKARGSGVWWIQYFDSTGRRRRELIGSKSSAIKMVESRRTAAREGVKIPVNIRARKITFAEIAESALAWSRANKRDSAHDEYRMPLLIERFGNCQAEDIKPSEITEWLQSRADWSRATRNRYTALLKMVYRQAEEAEKIRVNPTRLVRQRKENNDRIRYLSDSEEVRLRTVMEKTHADRIPEFEIALMTGMRMSEQLTLEWDEVDLDAGTIHLAQTKNGTSRFVRLNSRALAIMRTLYAHGIGNGRVFIAKRPDWFRAAVRERWHQGFHLALLAPYLCQPLDDGRVDLKTVQDLMGHKSITMTARYTHLSPEHRVAALEKLCQASATTTATDDKSGSKLVAPMVQ